MRVKIGMVLMLCAIAMGVLRASGHFGSPTVLDGGFIAILAVAVLAVALIGSGPDNVSRGTSDGEDEDGSD